MAGIELRGMTWSHPRGFDPLVAASEQWLKDKGVTIVWDKRSLQDFETYPVETLARQYDLIIIDHPHVGQIAAENCLAPFDDPARAADNEAMARASVGPSWPSYFWLGKQWALPIDAATQVLAWRPDLLAAPPSKWDEVMMLAREGAVICPMRPPHSLMALYTLTGALGRPCQVEGPDLVDAEAGAEALTRLSELMAHVDPKAYEWDPIAAFEAMVEPDSQLSCAPLIYGYVSYAFRNFRPRRLAFADIAALGPLGPVGSALGGTGLAVSAFSAHAKEAADFAYWVTSGPVQAGLYATAGGQPGHAQAWEADDVNAVTGDFYRATRKTLEGAWLRPRHNGYMPFQDAASEDINQTLRSRRPAREAIATLNQMFRKSLPL